MQGKINGHGQGMLSARLAEPFKEGTSAYELVDRPGFAAARRFWASNPAKFELVARDLFDLYSPATIARNHKIKVETVRQVRGLYPELVEAGKLRLMSNLEEASVALSTRLIDEVKDLDLSKVPAALATVVEKLSLLSGGATIRSEHVHSAKKVSSPEEIKALFERLPSV